jgi:four helix bundle protein
MQNPDKLRVSHDALELADLLYDFTATFPREERFGLTAQMRRAVLSIGSNIFEGCGRQSNRSLVAFLYNAHGSTGELVFQNRFAERRRYGDPLLVEAVNGGIVTMRRRLHSLIRYHERQEHY